FERGKAGGSARPRPGSLPGPGLHRAGPLRFLCGTGHRPGAVQRAEHDARLHGHQHVPQADGARGADLLSPGGPAAATRAGPPEGGLLMDTRPIGGFDSGLGGLPAVRQLRRVLPGEDIVYFGDAGRVPYGSRTRQTIVQYARQDIRFLLEQGVKFIIAACGTVSSTFPPEEAARLPVPYTGVVGAASRAAVAATRNRKIGIIGTAATIRSGSYAAVIRDMMPDVAITAKACPLFVPLVENGYVHDGNPVTKLVIADYLEEVRASGVDTLI